MSIEEQDSSSSSAFALETVDTAKTFNERIPSKVRAKLQSSVRGDTSHYMRTMNRLETLDSQPHGASLSISMDSSSKKGDPEPDTAGPYLAGFVIGWFTWIFGLLLYCYAGKGARSAALRRGLLIGAVAVTLPLSFFLAFIIVIINRWNAFLDKFPFGLLREVFVRNVL